MKGSSIFRLISVLAAFTAAFIISAPTAKSQDVGVGGGAGIFRPRNPETRKRTGRTTPVVRRDPARTTPANAATEERIEDLLEKGNEFRDARRSCQLLPHG